MFPPAGHRGRKALELQLRAHIGVTVGHRHLVGILTHERGQLPDKERTALRRYQADYLEVWVQTLGAVQADRETADLRTVVRATHAMIHSVIRSGQTALWPDLFDVMYGSVPRPNRVAVVGVGVVGWNLSGPRGQGGLH
ncbi:hypothetical protein [Streptomyces sp. NPDC005244]|uniref:hypothetical protein n=1 Tax=Streptomyces sp. NPDC005244 TaxID=3364708 RepID=UPI0036C5D68D